MDDWLFACMIPGDPIGKGRPRGTAAGGHVRLYTPKKTADWERAAAMVMSSFWRKAPIDAPVEVEIMAMASRPKRLLRKKDPDGLIWKPNKPDSDNIEKCTWDALVMAGVVRDDAQVVLNTTWSCYAPRDSGPKVCIRLRIVGKEPAGGWWDTVPRVPVVEPEVEFVDDLPW